MSTAGVHHNIGVNRLQLVKKSKTNTSGGLTYISLLMSASQKLGIFAYVYILFA